MTGACLMNGAWPGRRQGRARHRRRPRNGRSARARAGARRGQGRRSRTSRADAGEQLAAELRRRRRPSLVSRPRRDRSRRLARRRRQRASRPTARSTCSSTTPASRSARSASRPTTRNGTRSRPSTSAACSSACRRSFRRWLRNGGGSIINIASVAALVGLRGSLPYQASKAAVLGLTRGAAVSYGPRQHPRQRDLPRAGRHRDDRERIDGGGRAR